LEETPATYFPRAEGTPAISDKTCRIERLINAYRTYGHLAVAMNPLEQKTPAFPEELSLAANGLDEKDQASLYPTLGLLEEKEAPLLAIVGKLKEVYCSRIGFEFKGFTDLKVEKYLESVIEKKKIQFSLEDKLSILEKLAKSELLETFLHTKFPGQKRFSLEGAETLIPMLSELIEVGAQQGSETFVLGMAHRGRLNVLANILNKSYVDIFSEFDEGYFPDSFEGTGDVKYHKGFLTDKTTVKGRPVSITLMPNPSHLESVDPVVQGYVKGIQVKLQDRTKDKAISILVHGDAAISGQGVVYETEQMYKLKGYSTGGTLHLVVNNQIGFTTNPEDSRSTRYCTDIAKTFGAPVMHVNGEDPEACVYASILAQEIRHRFHIDVFIELNCYRKYGHNESDEPFYTQPLLYKVIRGKKSVRVIYGEQLIQEGALEKFAAESIEEEFKKSLNFALKNAETGKKSAETNSTESEKEPRIDTNVPLAELQKLAQAFCSVPDKFHLHPKLKQLFHERLNMTTDKEAMQTIDWGMGEFLALGTLASQNVPIRLAGQDSLRGTFSHRQAVWFDQENGEAYSPLQSLAANPETVQLINTPLSEYAALAFEYGYSLGYPESLVLWEAQFGDFANGAQVVIDQYISSAEQKWAQRSSITMLLPHGYEGQGPEHSSGRMERFLSLAGHDNMRIVNPSTPAQLFHLLRHQALDPIQKPLIVFTPKALLRLPECVSTIEQFSKGGFQEIIEDADVNATHLVFCSGKVYYDLKRAQLKSGTNQTAYVRVESLYPFPKEALKASIARYKSATRFSWVQEEPKNMGAYTYIQPQLSALLPKSGKLEYIGREASAAPAAGSYVLHKKELAEILSQVQEGKKKESLEIPNMHRA
ncbi:MAG: 2-oxoglutarate dehydrogenase E1 component, partial [Parachlamydiaceae bacterium]